MAEIDFITSLGRLLRDGNLRDAFSANPQAVAAQINLCHSDQPAFLQLIPEDLEFQSRILLRKRFDLVRQLLPKTIRKLGEQHWPLFLEYSRANWPTGQRAALHDAFAFCRHLQQQHPRLVSASEWNRLQFALSEKHLAVHWLIRETDGVRTRPMVQIFFRGTSKQWQELDLCFGF